MKKWYKWPEGYYPEEDDSYKPWYSILRAVVAYPLVIASFAVFYLSVVLMGGISEAEYIRKNIF